MIRSIILRCIGLACLLSTSMAAVTRCPGVVVQKSIIQAQDECVQLLRIPRARLAVYNELIYPHDYETKCMVRCMGLNLGWWNDTEGVKEAAIRAYFHPDPDDCQYDRRTYHCLKSRCLDSYTQQALDPCDRAYESFRCYYEQYGNIVVTPQYVPLSPLQLAAVMQDCAIMLQLHSGGVHGESGPSPLTDHNIGCLYRCVFIRSGLYSEQYGPNLDRIYVQGQGYKNETIFRELTATCFRQLKSECLDECDLIYRFVNECFAEGGLNLSLGLSASILARLSGVLLPIFSLLTTALLSAVPAIPAIPAIPELPGLPELPVLPELPLVGGLL